MYLEEDLTNWGAAGALRPQAGQRIVSKFLVVDKASLLKNEGVILVDRDDAKKAKGYGCVLQDRRINQWENE
jgi:hypothetical protein